MCIYIYGYVYFVPFTSLGPVTFRLTARSGAMRRQRLTKKVLRGASPTPYKPAPGTFPKPKTKMCSGKVLAFDKADLCPTRPLGHLTGLYKAVFCVHETTLFEKMYRLAYTELQLMETIISEFPISAKNKSVLCERGALFFGLPDLNMDRDFKNCNFTKRFSTYFQEFTVSRAREAHFRICDEHCRSTDTEYRLSQLVVWRA